jgi:hypothetical protein
MKKGRIGQYEPMRPESLFSTILAGGGGPLSGIYPTLPIFPSDLFPKEFQ